MTGSGSDALIGRVVDGRYTVLAHIADGGMGSVYAALDERLDRQVALKVMRSDLSRDADFVARFRREARAAARLSHPSVVAVHDQGEDDGLVFLVMEYVDGQTLRDRLREQGAMSIAEALDTAESLLEALRAAHRTGIVHRDIKPENVLISVDGQVKVADFGLARAMSSSATSAHTGPLLGTVAYLAPEQVEHGTSDARSDLYSAALVLHEMLTGRTAVTDGTPIRIAWQHVNGTLATPSSQAPDLPAALDTLVTGAEAVDPDDRYEDAEAFLAAIRSTRLGLTEEQLAHRASSPATSENGEAGATRLDTAPVHRPTATMPVPPPARPGRTPGSDRDTGDRPGDDTRGTDTRRATGRAAGDRPRGAGATSSARGGVVVPAATEPDPEVRPHPQRRHRNAWIAALVTLVLALGGAGYWWFGPPGRRTVPQVTATPLAQARDLLAREDLSADVAESFSEDVPRDTVIRSGLEPGTVVRRGTSVPLVVSKGPERYAVPDVTGATVDAATQAVTDARLRVAPRTEQDYDEKIPAGKVIRTRPVGGSPLRPGTEVTLVTSRGRRPVDTDPAVGRPVEEATSILETAGLTVTVADARVYDTDVPEGSVVRVESSTTPVYRGDPVTLVVSRGPEMVEVPSVAGKSASEAKALLRAAGFRVEVERIAGGILGLAHSTDPSRGLAPKGSTITLRIV